MSNLIKSGFVAFSQDQTLVIDANDPNAAGYVTELDGSNTISPGNKVWKVKYPSEGVEALGWPALSVEKLPLNDSGDVIDNHGAANHTDRYYWFVTEEVPGWATETYSNENAENPGKINNEDYYKDSLWVAASLKDKDTALGNVPGTGLFKIYCKESDIEMVFFSAFVLSKVKFY